MAHVSADALDWVPIDAERLKRVYDDLVTTSGARVLFHTMLSAVQTDRQGPSCTGIIRRVRSIAT